MNFIRGEKNLIIQSEWLGQIPFLEGERLQQAHAKHVQATGHGVVLGLEHDPVITLGVRGVKELDVDVSTSLTVYQTDRGGQATLHNPGQLVVYPVLPLRTWGLKPRVYLTTLMESLVDWLKRHDVPAFFREDAAGIYTDAGKIAFLGVRIENGVTRHGFSLNVANDLSCFEAIRSCGQTGAVLDSLQKRQLHFTTKDVFASWMVDFQSRVKRLR